jgi:hypothetical protein
MHTTDISRPANDRDRRQVCPPLFLHVARELNSNVPTDTQLGGQLLHGLGRFW